MFAQGPAIAIGEPRSPARAGTAYPPRPWRSRLVYTGLRWGEMDALQVRDIDPLRPRMLIARSVTENNGR